MKILHLTPHFYIPENFIDEWEVDLDQIGGMQTQIYRQCKLLETEGLYQEVLTILPNNRKRIELSDKLIIKKSNWRMLPIKSKINCTAGLNFYWSIGTFFNLLYYKIKRINFDCIHVHCSGVSAPLIIALISQKLFNSRIVLTIHCSRIATYKPMGVVDKLFNKVARKIEKKH
ncbi:MAG: glycosyltransferase [Clostridiales bacterium]|nr:glycosyltransferase [Clostridiales bacterium]